MLNFTLQERRVLLFLSATALLGLGINFALKANSRLTRIIRIDNRIAKVDINKAGFRELCLDAAISPKFARDIIEYRNAKGPFRDISQLKEIKGIGDYRYERIKDIFFIE